MPSMADAYTWSAQRLDGVAITEGADLRGCVGVTLTPTRPGLPTHTIAGVELVRRFGRGFLRGMGGGMREYLHCIVGRDFRVYVRCSDGGMLVTPADFELYL